MTQTKHTSFLLSKSEPLANSKESLDTELNVDNKIALSKVQKCSKIVQ